MSGLVGSIRRMILAPSLTEVTFAARGFPVTESAATRALEAVPQAVVCGFEWAIDLPGQWDVERRLNLVDRSLQGFAYEGATMAYTVRDAMAGGRGRRTREFLRGPGRPHILLAYIGIGFAMARLPRALWKNVIPELTGPEYFPAMHWLAVDGYGFDRAYFDTARWVDQQRVPEPYPWSGSPEYFLRAVDQGIGRALWFIHGADVDAVPAAVQRFAEHRWPDLWSGVGLAATFAGGCSPEELVKLMQAAGDLEPELAQGSVFAAKGRQCSGFVPEHSSTATEVLTGLSFTDAVALADAAETRIGPETQQCPRYEGWRRAVRAGLPAGRS